MNDGGKRETAREIGRTTERKSERKRGRKNERKKENKRMTEHGESGRNRKTERERSVCLQRGLGVAAVAVVLAVTVAVVVAVQPGGGRLQRCHSLTHMKGGASSDPPASPCIAKSDNVTMISLRHDSNRNAH